MVMNFAAKEAAATNDFWGKIAKALLGIYNGIASIITIVAAVAVAICTVGMIASKNQRTVEEFKAWRTRVFISWLVFFMLGVLVTLGTDVTEGLNLDSSLLVGSLSIPD